jgi:hypothetical protein
MTERRKKAQDVLNESNLVFARKATFAEAFPEIDEIRVVVTESGEGVYRDMNKRSYDKRTVSEFVNCSNPLCYNGGVRLGSIIHEMNIKKETYKEDHFKCQGYEGSPKGRRVYRDCFNFFTVSIDIQYKNSEPKPAG